MLSTSSIAVVRETLPVVGGAIGDITPIFYRRMFAAHPELERDLFNRGNQAQGDQQRALASAIASYATLLVSEDGPDPREVLPRIAHKHASLGITAEQYLIVHEHLFAAIVEVLGDAVTPVVAAAWDEVYWDMAHALIAMETDLYSHAGVAPGDVWRTVVVRERIQETPQVASFVLAASDGEELPAGEPGQYLSVRVRMPDGAHQIRQYSLTGAPEPGTWSFSVKAVEANDEGALASPAGEVSNVLHGTVVEGDVLEVSLPFGELVLDVGDAPLVLASAGIGITPMIGFLRHLIDSDATQPVLVLHADHSPVDHAHRAELAELVDSLPTGTLHRWYSDPGEHAPESGLHAGRIDLADIDIPSDPEVFLCGPLPFMASVHDVLTARGVRPSQVHYEVFGPERSLAGV